MNDIPLRDYIDTMLRERDQRHNDRFESINHRLSGMNDARGAMADLAKDMMPRLEYLSEHRALVAKLETLERTLQAKMDTFSAATNDRIGTFQTTMDNAQGQFTGVRQFWGWITAMIAIVLSTIGVLFHFKGP